MKILHISSFYSAKKNIGVVRQLEYELEAINNLKIDWEIELWAGEAIKDKVFVYSYPKILNFRFMQRFYYFQRLRKVCSLYDVVLIRYMPCDVFIPFLKSSKARIIFVYHTKVENSLRSLFPGLKGLILVVIEKIIGRFSSRRVDGVIGVTPEITEYAKNRCHKKDVPSLSVPNGISYSNFRVCDDLRGGPVKIIFTASKFFSWHGLSNILEEFLKYKENNIEFHLVGEVLEHDLLFIEKKNLKNNVFVHGYLKVSDLRNLLNRMDVGLASFNLNHSGLSQACTLKVREYLAAGLPVYSGHIDSAFPESFEYFKFGPLDFNEICKFGIQKRQISRESIRDAAHKYIEKTQLVMHTYSWIKDKFPVG